MRFTFFLFTMYLLFKMQGFAQVYNRQNAEQHVDPANINNLMLSADYVTNTNVLGYFNPATKQPSFCPALSYFSKWGADVSAMFYFVGNSDDSLEHYTTELDLMLGYNFRPGRNFTIYPSYTHFFHSSNSNSLKSIFSDDFRLDADYHYKFLSLGTSLGYYLGRQNTFYTTLYNYYEISFERFLSRRASLMIQPGFDLNFGSYEYLNLYYLDELRKDPLFYYYLLSYPAIRRYVFRELIRNPGKTKEEILDDYLSEQAGDSFKLTSICLNLPLYYMIGDFWINLGFYFIIPFGQPDYMSDETQFFFDVGVTYNFMLGGR